MDTRGDPASSEHHCTCANIAPRSHDQASVQQLDLPRADGCKASIGCCPSRENLPPAGRLDASIRDAGNHLPVRMLVCQCDRIIAINGCPAKHVSTS